MKTKKFFIWVMMILAVAVISCDDDDGDDESCDSENLAEDFNCPVDVDAIATFCSDGVNDSYYIYAGTNYMCTGVDVSTCDDALNQIGAALLEAGCGAKKSGSVDAAKIKLSKMAENLLEEVRTKSIYE
jgi:hypothetical protein